MWGDSRVDVWFTAMCLSCLASLPLFFSTRPSMRWLYLSFPITLLFWLAYETAIGAYLSTSVPIRIDVVIVVPMAFFPLVPIAVNFARMKLRRKKEMASNKGVQAIGDKSPQPDP